MFEIVCFIFLAEGSDGAVRHQLKYQLCPSSLRRMPRVQAKDMNITSFVVF